MKSYPVCIAVSIGDEILPSYIAVYIGDEILPSYIGIFKKPILKDLYELIRIILECQPRVSRFVMSVLLQSHKNYRWSRPSVFSSRR